MKHLQPFIYRLFAFFRGLKERFRKRKQQPPPLRLLSVSQEEKQELAAFQSRYVNESSSSSASMSTAHFKQSQQLTVSISSGQRPPPAGIAKILDLCKNAN